MSRPVLLLYKADLSIIFVVPENYGFHLLPESLVVGLMRNEVDLKVCGDARMLMAVIQLPTELKLKPSLLWLER